MAEGSGIGTVAVAADEAAFRELSASRHELVTSVVKQIEFSVAQMNSTPAEARERFRRYLHDDPETVETDQVTWLDLSALFEEDPERGQALWQRLKHEADDEVATGVRAASVLERPNATRPMERAAFIAIVNGLRQALAPRDALEELLIQQMASSYELHLRWQEILVRRMEEEVWQGERDQRRAIENMSPRQRERYQATEGWVPPRLAETEALEQAAVLSDRAQRAFLRLLKAFRDNRRMFGALIVAGGQVNIGERQVNVEQTVQHAPPARRVIAARVRASPVLRKRKTRAETRRPAP